MNLCIDLIYCFHLFVCHVTLCDYEILEDGALCYLFLYGLYMPGP